jgi:hypothetical protein
MLDQNMDYEEEFLFEHQSPKIYEESKEEMKIFDANCDYP